MVKRRLSVGSWRHAASALALGACLAVVACGDEDDDKNTENPSTAVNAPLPRR